MSARTVHELQKIMGTNGVDLTFATYPAANSQSECQIRNSTRMLILASGPLILIFAKLSAEKRMRMLEPDHWHGYNPGVGFHLKFLDGIAVALQELQMGDTRPKTDRLNAHALILKRWTSVVDEGGASGQDHF
jgi:hypothetical protein